MPISITCAACRSAFQVNEAYLGKRGKCPRCQNVIVIAAPAPVVGAKAIPARPTQADSPHALMREILEAFQGDVEPTKRTAGYSIGLVFVALAILVLPILYLGLVGGIANLVFYHATHGMDILGKVSLWGLLYLYIGPLVVGVILLFFMVKPLFARSSRSQKLRTLELDEAPLLFALVTRIASAVGAPEPKRIDVDCQANASASFGNLFGLLFGGNFVLTVGLPLVAGLSIQELAGIIAHELGHFKQGAGMRLSFMVRSLNDWLARIVYQRDDWDESLVNGCQTGARLGIIFYVALFCVWLTRRVFWLFMMLGHALSCFMTRQMEYDADRCSARLAGAAAFWESSSKITLLALANDSALGMAFASHYVRGKLPDDMSALAVALTRKLSPKQARKLEKSVGRVKTGLFDTHPSNADRLASVQAENAAGVFHLPGPATRLFKDFDKTSRAVTKSFYRQALGKSLKRVTILSVDEFLGDGEK